MKAFTFLFAAILFSFAVVSCQKDDIQPQKSPADAASTKSNLNRSDASLKIAPVNAARTITYLVNIHILSSLSLCNAYLVEMTDGNGNLVAEPKTYIQGINVYEFHEAGPVQGMRVAKMVPVVNEGLPICSVILTTRPDVLIPERGFRNGMTYIFDLYPNNLKPMAIE